MGREGRIGREGREGQEGQEGKRGKKGERASGGKRAPSESLVRGANGVSRGTSALIVLVMTAACGGPAGSPAPADAPQPAALAAVALPALDGIEPALQERIRASQGAVAAAEPEGPAARAATFGRVGALLLAAGFYEHAEPYLANAHALSPSDVAWPYYYAHAARLRHDPDTAIARFTEVLRLQPGYFPALVWLGTLHLDGGRPAEAEPLLQAAAADRPADAAARFALGRAALALGQPRRAATEIEAALGADPGADAARYALAMAYRELGETAQAQAQAARWKNGTIYPSDPLMEEIGRLLQTAVSYEVMGTRALDEQRWAEASAHFRKGLDVAPRDATLHQNLGTALALGGDAAGAEREFHEALRLLPGYARAAFSLGLLAEDRGDDADAVARYRQALGADPALVTARFALADVLRRGGQVEESLAHYRQVLTADPSASQARFAYAMGLVRLGRFVEARAALEESDAMFPAQPGFAHALARVLAAAPDPAVRDGARALAIVGALQRLGTSPALEETGAMALAEVGRYAEAAAVQRELAAEARRAGLPAVADRLGLQLREYEAGRPCRQPWAADDPVHQPRASALGGR